MAIEIERKFLVCSDAWRDSVIRSELRRQGYLARTPKCIVRVRSSANEAVLTVKSPRKGFVRHEFEYAIPVREAEHMLQHLCVTPVVEKDLQETIDRGHGRLRATSDYADAVRNTDIAFVIVPTPSGRATTSARA